MVEDTAVSTPETEQAAPRRNGGKSVLIGLLLSALSIVMLVLAQREFGGVWPLAFIALVPLIVAQYRFMPRRLSGLPLALGWAGYWLAWASLSAQIAPWPIPLFVPVVFFLIGLLVASFDRKLSERTGYKWFLLQLPVTWVAVDMLLSGNLASGGEGHYAQLVAPFYFMLSTVSIFGEASLTFFLVMLNCAIALVIIGALDKKRPPVDSVSVDPKVVRRTAITALAVTAAWFIAAAVLFTQTRSQQGEPAKVAAIQIGPTDGFNEAGWGPGNDQLEPDLAQLTEDAARQGAKYVVWGEIILNYDPREDKTQFVQKVARDNGVYLQTGFTVGTGPTASNIVGLWDPQGKFVGLYYKIHPVILDGEDFVQPKRYPVFDTSIGTVGMLICFDFSFEDPTRYMVAGGANIMSASVGDWTNFAPTRIATVQIRAAENRVPFIKGEDFNGSALIDATGKVLASADPGPDGGKAVLVGDIQPGPRNAIYTTIGPVFGYLCVLGLILRIIAQIVLWRRSRSAAT